MLFFHHLRQIQKQLFLPIHINELSGRVKSKHTIEKINKNDQIFENCP